MTLTPLADRVLIQPDSTETVSASGIVLVENSPIEQTGVVVSTGCARHPLKEVAEDLARRLLNRPGFDDLTQDAAQMLRDLTGREPELKVGDRVVFSPYVGQEIVIGEERYLVMREADVLAVLESA